MAVREIGVNCRSITGRQGLSGQQFESALERDLLDLLKFDLDVERYETQPLTIYYEGSDQKSYTYTPDVLVHYRHQKPSSLMEVKYRDEYRERYCELRARFRAAHRYARVRGWSFRVVTDREIRTPYLENARFLHPYRDLCSDLARDSLLIEMLGRMGGASPKSLLDALSDNRIVRGELLPRLWKLLADFQVSADLTVKLDMHSPIWLQAKP